MASVEIIFYDARERQYGDGFGITLSMFMRNRKRKLEQSILGGKRFFSSQSDDVGNILKRA